MKNVLFAFAAVLTLFFGSGCQRNAGAPAPEAPRATSDTRAASRPEPVPERELAPSQTTLAYVTPLLWKATSPSGHFAYLLGSIHLGVDAAKELPPFVWQALDAAPSFVMETDLSEPSLVTSMQRTDGRTLRAEIGEAAWTKLEAAVGAPMAKGLDKLKATAATTLLMLRGMPITVSMDMALYVRAKQAKKQIVYLEEARFQMGLLERFMGAAALVYVLDRLDDVARQNQELLAAYKRGDEEMLARIMLDPEQWKPAGQDAVEAILLRRNRDWVPKIAAMMNKGREGGQGPVAFIAVGAGHLVGADSVLDLLAKQGFRIERVIDTTGEPALDSPMGEAP